MKFLTAILALGFAASTTAMTCGVSGSFCDYATSKRSLGFTSKAREFMRARAAEVEAPKEARDAAMEAVEVQI